jgi:hypothetical protein
LIFVVLSANQQPWKAFVALPSTGSSQGAALVGEAKLVPYRLAPPTCDLKGNYLAHWLLLARRKISDQQSINPCDAASFRRAVSLQYGLTLSHREPIRSRHVAHREARCFELRVEEIPVAARGIPRCVAIKRLA